MLKYLCEMSSPCYILGVTFFERLRKALSLAIMLEIGLFVYPSEKLWLNFFNQNYPNSLCVSFLRIGLWLPEHLFHQSGRRIIPG